MRDPRSFLLSLFREAVAAADPGMVMPPFLASLAAAPRTLLVGGGKAALGMARAACARLAGQVEGVIVVPRGMGGACPGITVLEAGHPVPDPEGVAAATRVLAAVSAAPLKVELTPLEGPPARVLCLLSGGASSLLTLPAPGLTLQDKQDVTRALLRCGAPIGAINVVRRHLSAIKGGRLALAAWPVPMLTLALSDVPGDLPEALASGPTVPDPTTRAGAIATLRNWGIEASPAVTRWLDDPASETPKPGDPRLATASFRIVASARTALDGAVAHARRAGWSVLDLGDAVQGEARDVARHHAALVRDVARGRGPISPPCLVLSGGETTVTVRGQGRGGRNREYLLALALALEGMAGVWALAADTDGIDGNGPEAGAWMGPDTLPRARALGLDPGGLLDDNDAGAFFATLGDVVTTGPTGTNVNDFRAILVPGASVSVTTGLVGRGQGFSIGRRKASIRE